MAPQVFHSKQRIQNTEGDESNDRGLEGKNGDILSVFKTKTKIAFKARCSALFELVLMILFALHLLPQFPGVGKTG